MLDFGIKSNACLRSLIDYPPINYQYTNNNLERQLNALS